MDKDDASARGAKYRCADRDYADDLAMLITAVRSITQLDMTKQQTPWNHAL